MINDIEKLRKHGKKTITKTELEILFSTAHEEKLFQTIKPLIEEHILTPLKNAKTNGNLKYPIHLKYNITLPTVTYDKELSEIASLHPLLQKNEYLQKRPEEYKNHRADLEKLDHYLFIQSHTNTKIPISRKERSFEIFGDEKKLDNRSFCNFLEKLDLKHSKVVLAVKIHKSIALH